MIKMLLTEDLSDRFEHHINSSVEVRIASAWLTRTAAFDRIIELRSLKSIRLLIGTAGANTDPDCLENLLQQYGEKSLRLANFTDKLFHPKVYLFGYSTGYKVAWIGSANFTGAGWEKNIEIVMEFDEEKAVVKLEEWFDTFWISLANQDISKEVELYRVVHEKSSQQRSKDIQNSLQGDDLQISDNHIKEIHLFSGKSSVSNKAYRKSGSIIFSKANSEPVSEEPILYGSASEALRIVLSELNSVDTLLFDILSARPSTAISHRGYEPSRMLSRNINEIYEVRAQKGEIGPKFKDRSVNGVSPEPIIKGWWISHDISLSRVRKMIFDACVVGNVELFWNQKLITESNYRELFSKSR